MIQNIQTEVVAIKEIQEIEIEKETEIEIEEEKEIEKEDTETPPHKENKTIILLPHRHRLQTAQYRMQIRQLAQTPQLQPLHQRKFHITIQTI